MSVFVRWYGSVLQGEVVENREKGILGGMVAVRILVQGAKATALFVPGHVYQSAKDASEKEYDPRSAKHKEFVVSVSGNAPEISVSAQKVDEKPHEIARNEAKVSIEDLNVLKFKAENWNHERNHLRIDALDEFYRLWRDNMAMRLGTNKPQPAMKMEAPLTPDDAIVTLPSQKPQPIVIDERMAELKTQLKKSLKPVEAKQLTLFD